MMMIVKMRILGEDKKRIRVEKQIRIIKKPPQRLL